MVHKNRASKRHSAGLTCRSQVDIYAGCRKASEQSRRKKLFNKKVLALPA
ncbi:MAG: hypothetical protein J6A33_00235 [Alphaproteobacteria bacterium]|nr:hypothetical protein [Alphaproteobacteria bacterium]